MGRYKRLNLGGNFGLLIFNFDDNILIFSDGLLRDLLNISEILDIFYMATIMMVNETKSMIMVEGIEEEYLNQYSL